MSFVKRVINVHFYLADGNGVFKETGENILRLSGYRVETVVSMQGAVGLEFMHLRIWGMKLSDMNKLSTQTRSSLAITGNLISVSAGDEGAPIKQIFFGGIQSAFIDFAGAPDVSFDVMASPASPGAEKPAAPNSTNGMLDVAEKLSALASVIGFAFINNGVKVKLLNQYLCGTAVDQIKTLIQASGIAASFANQTLSIWPNDGFRDDKVIEIGPKTGLVGYPEFSPTGANVKTLFNPDALPGRKANVTSAISMAAGDWAVSGVVHELSTMMPGGPWFTTFNMSGPRYAPRN
jgi:hypothetical protein